MLEDTIDIIMEKYNALTKSKKKVVDYVLSHVVDTQYMSINNLADECNVSLATITRLCRDLGYKGYNDFKLGLVKSNIKRENGDTQSYLHGKISNNDSISDMSKKLCSTNIGALNHTLKLLDEHAVIEATNIISAAQKVHFIGQGNSQIMAMEAWGRFLAVDSKFSCIQDSHLQAIAASLLKHGDAIICFSYSGSTKELIDVLPGAKSRGVKVILVTHFKKSPASEYADVVFLCGSTEGPLQMGSIATRMAQLFIIDILFSNYFRKNSESAANNQVLTTDALANKLI
jgi:DNA-binding MurR/RpiR family transcriptional regulator